MLGFRLLHQLADETLEAAVSGQTEHIVNAIGFAPLHDRLAAKTRVSTNNDARLRPMLAYLSNNPAQFLHTARRPVLVRWTQSRTQQMLAAEDVQRQIAVAAVVAVKEAPFLLTVQRIVGGIQIQPDFFRGPRVRFDKQIDQQPVDTLSVGHDPLVTTPRSRFRTAQLQSIERARTRQRIPLVTRTCSALSRQIAFTHHQRQQTVAPQRVVIVQILIPQRHTIHPLRDQAAHIMFDQFRISIIDKTPRQPIHQSQPNINLSQQHSAAVRADPAPITSAHHLASSQGVKLKLFGDTLCRHRPLISVASKVLFALTLSTRSRPISIPAVRFPG